MAATDRFRRQHRELQGLAAVLLRAAATPGATLSAREGGLADSTGHLAPGEVVAHAVYVPAGMRVTVTVSRALRSRPRRPPAARIAGVQLVEPGEADHAEVDPRDDRDRRRGRNTEGRKEAAELERILQDQRKCQRHRHEDHDGHKD